MDRLKNVSQIVLMIAIPILILTLSQNIIYRLPDAYLYYFNDSQCLDEIYVSMSNSEMADALTDLLNTFRPDSLIFMWIQGMISLESWIPETHIIC